jgi:hypothetical protein
MRIAAGGWPILRYERPAAGAGGGCLSCRIRHPPGSTRPRSRPEIPASLPEPERNPLIGELSEDELAKLVHDWSFWRGRVKRDRRASYRGPCRDREFESGFLQRRVCEPSVPLVFHPIPDAGPLQRDRRPRPGPRGCNWRGVQRRQAFFQTAPGWCPVPVHPIKAIQPRGQLMAWRYCSVARGCWRELHICRDDGCEPRHGGRPHRSLQALARRLQLGPLELCSAVVFPMRGVSVLKPLMHSRHTGDRGSNPIKVRAPGQFIRPSRASGNPGISVTCPEPPLSRGDDCERARNFITTSPASTRAEEPSRKDSPPQFFAVR